MLHHMQSAIEEKIKKIENCHNLAMKNPTLKPQYKMNYTKYKLIKMHVYFIYIYIFLVKKIYFVYKKIQKSSRIKYVCSNLT